jgi:hypothetical protein
MIYLKDLTNSLLSESMKKVKMQFPIGGNHKAVVIFTAIMRDDRLVLIPSTSQDADKVGDLLKALDWEGQRSDFYKFITNNLVNRTGLEFYYDNSYKGAGYGFKLNTDSILKKLM